MLNDGTNTNLLFTIAYEILRLQLNEFNKKYRNNIDNIEIIMNLQTGLESYLKGYLKKKYSLKTVT